MKAAGVDTGDRLVWFRSSYSNGAGGECVECALTGEKALVRDSKCDPGSAIALGSAAWRAFLSAILEQQGSATVLVSL